MSASPKVRLVAQIFHLRVNLLSKILGREQTKLLGGKVAITDEYMGISQLLGGRDTCPGCPPKSIPMTHTLTVCFMLLLNFRAN